jgi:cell division protein FtsI/penicillin-binding protein 2
MVVLVENGGFGGQVAAPVAKAVYEAAFGGRHLLPRMETAEAKEPEVGD